MLKKFPDTSTEITAVSMYSLRERTFFNNIVSIVGGPIKLTIIKCESSKCMRRVGRQ